MNTLPEDWREQTRLFLRRQTGTLKVHEDGPTIGDYNQERIIDHVLDMMDKRIHLYDPKRGHYLPWARLLMLRYAWPRERDNLSIEGEQLIDVPLDIQEESGPDIDHLHEARDKAIHTAMSEHLTDKQRLVIQRRIFESVPVVDIAKELGIKRATVYTLYARAIVNLKKALEGHIDLKLLSTDSTKRAIFLGSCNDPHG